MPHDCVTMARNTGAAMCRKEREMRIVIVGSGKVGFAIANQLTNEGHDIVLIEKNKEVIRQLDESLDILFLHGNGASMKTLREADMVNSDLLIATTPQDEVNMVCCMLARKLGCSNTIARVRNPEYAEQMHYLKDDLGLSMSINPELTTAREIFRLLQVPGFLKRDSFSKGSVEIVEIDLKEDNKLVGLSLMEIARKTGVKMLVCAVDRAGECYIPDGKFQLEAGDKIHVIAPATALRGLLSFSGRKLHHTKDVMIVGGGKTTEYLTEMLIRASIRVKIIESSPERSEYLAEIFPDAMIICADGTSQRVLNNEGVHQMDSVVTLTNMDEENLLVSLYASHVGVCQVITKISRSEYGEVYRSMGVSCIISPKHLCAQLIIQYVRAMQNKSGGSVLAVNSLVDGKAEAIEFAVTAASRNLGVTLRDVTLKPNILIASITRMGRVILPGGEDALEVGDNVVVVTAANRIILDLNDIFADEAWDGSGEVGI